MLELNKIYQGDNLELLKKIDNNSIDLLITDPPYCIGTTSNGKKGSWLDNNLIKPYFDILFTELLRVLKNGAELYINTDWRTYPFLYPILLNYFDIRNLIVWYYEWIKAGSHYRFSHEFIIYGFKGENKRTFYAGERDVWRIKPMNFTAKDKRHNAEKPVELIDKMILNSSNENDTVLDCFIGSGTTAISCIKNKRNYIGMELSERYCEVANQRIKEHKQQLVLV